MANNVTRAFQSLNVDANKAMHVMTRVLCMNSKIQKESGIAEMTGVERIKATDRFINSLQTTYKLSKSTIDGISSFIVSSTKQWEVFECFDESGHNDRYNLVGIENDLKNESQFSFVIVSIYDAGYAHLLKDGIIEANETRDYLRYLALEKLSSSGYVLRYSSNYFVLEKRVFTKEFAKKLQLAHQKFQFATGQKIPYTKGCFKPTPFPPAESLSLQQTKTVAMSGLFEELDKLMAGETNKNRVKCDLDKFGFSFFEEKPPKHDLFIMGILAANSTREIFAIVIVNSTAQHRQYLNEESDVLYSYYHSFSLLNQGIAKCLERQLVTAMRE